MPCENGFLYQNECICNPGFIWDASGNCRPVNAVGNVDSNSKSGTFWQKAQQWLPSVLVLAGTVWGEQQKKNETNPDGTPAMNYPPPNQPPAPAAKDRSWILWLIGAIVIVVILALFFRRSAAAPPISVKS